MGNSRFQLLFFVLFVLLVVGINIFIFLPYFTVLFLALVFSIVFAPLHNHILKSITKNPSLGALISTVIVFLIIIGPIFFFGTLLFQEASHLYGTLGSGVIDSGATKSIDSLNTFLVKLFPNSEISHLELDIEAYASKGLSWIIGHTSSLFSGALKIVLGLLLMLLSLFYFFRDGKKFISAIVEMSPLQNVYDEKIVARMILAVNSVVRGNIIIGLIQGVLTGIGFYFFGVPSPALWGTVASVASLIPSIGTSLVIVPGILFLFFAGDINNALGLLIWGGVAVGFIDNFLGPILIKKDIHIHPLLILLSAIGGVAFFGPIGFLAGPVSLALLFALFDIYPDIIKSERSSS